MALLSESILIMFVVAEFFALLNRSGGDCVRASTRRDCLQVVSSAAPAIAICRWHVDSVSRVQQCVFSSAGKFLSVRVTVGAAAAAIGAVLSLLLNAVFYRCYFSSSPALRGDYDHGDSHHDVLAPHITAASLDDESAIALCKIRFT